MHLNLRYHQEAELNEGVQEDSTLSDIKRIWRWKGTKKENWDSMASGIMENPLNFTEMLRLLKTYVSIYITNHG
jgi:hypothetical protein